jgi:hypothetical protein
MSSLVHKGGGCVKREAEAGRGADEDADGDAGVADGDVKRGHGCRCRAWRGRGRWGRTWHGDILRGTCNRRRVDWSNGVNCRTGREEGVEVIGRWAKGGKGEG